MKLIEKVAFGGTLKRFWRTRTAGQKAAVIGGAGLVTGLGAAAAIGGSHSRMKENARKQLRDLQRKQRAGQLEEKDKKNLAALQQLRKGGEI